MEFIIAEEKIAEWKRLANDTNYLASARIIISALLAEREQLFIEIMERDESNALFEKVVMSAVRRAGELLGKGNYDNIDHAAERVVKERDELRVHLAKWAREYERWTVTNSVNGVYLRPEIDRLHDEVEHLQYELKMQTIRAEHAESDIGGVREEQWYEVRNKELEAEVERLQQWVNDLQSGMYINCVYCGHRYGPEDKVPATMSDVLKEHIEQCPKHPASALKREIEQLRAELDDIHQCKDRLYYCAWAERLARDNDKLKTIALKSKEMFDANDLWIDGIYGGARAVELRELVNQWFVDSEEPT